MVHYTGVFVISVTFQKISILPAQKGLDIPGRVVDLKGPKI